MKKTLLACLCISALLGGYFLFHKPSKKEVEQYCPKTWSAFQEYPRLEMLIDGFSIQSMLDILAVDIAELKDRKLPIKTYIGACKDKETAIGLQARFGSDKRSFLTLDPTVDLLPKTDLIIAWDYLTTLERSEMRSCFLHFKKSGAKFLLMTHDPKITQNKKNKTGLPQPVNWKIEPYNFPEPLITFDKYALWNLNTL